MVVAAAFHSTADAVCARRWQLMRIGRWWLLAVPLLLRRRQRMAVVPPPSPSASARPAPRGLAPQRRCVLEQRCLASRGRGTRHQRNLPHASGMLIADLAFLRKTAMLMCMRCSWCRSKSMVYCQAGFMDYGFPVPPSAQTGQDHHMSIRT